MQEEKTQKAGGATSRDQLVRTSIIVVRMYTSGRHDVTRFASSSVSSYLLKGARGSFAGAAAVRAPGGGGGPGGPLLPPGGGGGAPLTPPGGGGGGGAPLAPPGGGGGGGAPLAPPGGGGGGGAAPPLAGTGVDCVEAGFGPL